MKTCKYGCGGKMKSGGKVTTPVKKMKTGGVSSNPCFPKCSDGKGGCVSCPSTRAGDALIKTGLAAVGKYVAKTFSKNQKSKKTETAKTEAAQETAQEKRKGGSVKKYAAGGSTIVGMPQYSNNPRTYSGRMLKDGGSFAPNRAVQPSCKNGMVRDASGKCVMSRSFKKGGFPDLNKDGKITKADILKGRGVIKKLGRAKKK